MSGALQQRCPWGWRAVVTVAFLLAASAQLSAAVSTPAEQAKASSQDPVQFQSIPALPGCSGSDSASSKQRSLTPELQHCSWAVQMQRQSSRWYAFEVTPEYANNMSVVIMARAVSGQITMALWGPGSDPYRSVPTQVGTNYMEWPGLREVDQEDGQAGGGHASLASEQQYLFLSHRGSKPLLVGQYVVVIQADMGQPLVDVEVSTPSSMTQLMADEQEALKDLVRGCCPGLGAPGSPEAKAAEAAAAAGLGTVSGWCSSVGQAVTYDLRQWYSDICHVAPNVCSKDGHLQRLVLPPYALRCSSFPKVLSKFPKLRHLDISYSVAPGSLSDVAAVVADLPELQQLHLRGLGLSGPFSCELLNTARQLKVLALSDNDKLSGELPACWLGHSSLQELQLAGLSDLHGPLPDLTGASSSSEALCGFGKLKYVNMAGIIGDAGLGFTGSLPQALGFCKDLLYLDLSGHSLSGSLPALPPSIQFLNVSSNGLTGSLPEFAVDAQLQYLDLSFNRFSGTLQDMTLLPSLDWLDLSDNSLGGPMPPLPPSVRWVDLSNNQLSGAVKLPVAPRHADESVALVLLNVANNKLSGPLPAELARLPSLAFLDLSHNQLTGSLDGFGAALTGSNNLLQVNLARNKLSGGVPSTLQQLAAVRPVRVTMKDGYTPVTRIFDISNNDLSGTFPAWLITNVPQLVSSCQCSVGVNLDGPKFSCPTSLPRLTRQAQTILHRFEFLQCITDDKSYLKGLEQRQLIPVYFLTAGPGARPMLSRAEHKQQVMQWHLVDPEGGPMQGRGQQGQQAWHRQRAAAAGAMVGVLLAMALAAAMVVMRGRQQRGWNNTGREAGGAGYSVLPDYSSYQPASPPGRHSSTTPTGSDGSGSPFAHNSSSGRSSSSSSSSSSSHNGSQSPTASSSGTRTARSSCCGDGVVEIALVLRTPTADGAACEGGDAAQGGSSSSKAVGRKDGDELL